MDALTASVPLAAQELGDLRLKGGLEEERDSQPGYLLEDVAELTARAEELIELGANAARWRILVVTRASGTS